MTAKNIPWSRNFNYTPHHTDNPEIYTPPGCNKNRDYVVQHPILINLEVVDDHKKERIFSSAKKNLSLNNPQFYNPYFDIICNNEAFINHDGQQNANSTEHQTMCLSSKYKIVDIDFIIDSDNEYAEVEDEDESNIVEDTPDIYAEKLTIAEEDFNKLPDETKDIVTEIRRQEHLECKMRASTDDDKIINCFPVMAGIERLDSKTNTIKTYKQKIFCKRSPLLEPLKIILNEQTKITPSTNITNISADVLNNTATKINSIHNSSHVEAFGLYCLSKLTENNLCPTFPYYFGCLNGISNIYYHNITEEMPDLYKKKWFIDKSHNGEFEIIYVDLNEQSETCSKCNSSVDLDEILQHTIQSNELDEVSSISSMDDEELTSLSNVLQNRINELDADDTVKASETIVTTVPETIIKSGEPVLKEQPKIVYPDTDEFNFDGFDIDVQIGGTQETFNNTTNNMLLAAELEDGLDMESIINMRDFLHNKVFFAKFRDMPVNYCFMERLGETLDDLLNTTGGISEEEWLSILFQVIFGLAVANKHYSFVHNDLHSDNILFQSTKETYIYYAIKDVKPVKSNKEGQEDITSKSKSKYKIFRIPTFGKVTKIIDFARATFKFGNKWIFSDVFMPNGEAAGQYKFPECADEVYWGCDFIGADEPNPSFDLARLARSIKHQVNIKSVYGLIKKWSKSDDGSNMLDKEDDFDLYVDIAKNCHNAVPKHVLQDKIFKKFEIPRTHVPKGKHIYIL